MERKALNPWKWQEQYGFVQANEIRGAERTVFCSGQVSIDEEGNSVHTGDMGAQIAKSLDNVEAVLATAGLDLSHVVRLNYYTTDIDGFLGALKPTNKRLAEAGCRPTSTLLGVASLAFPELLIEIEATAVA